MFSPSFTELHSGVKKEKMNLNSLGGLAQLIEDFKINLFFSTHFR